MVTIVLDDMDYRRKYVQSHDLASLTIVDAETAKVLCPSDCENCQDNINYAIQNNLKVLVARSEGFSRDAVAVIAKPQH